MSAADAVPSLASDANAVPAPAPRETAHSVAEFSEALTRIGTAAVQVLTLLNDVTALKRQQILGLAEMATHAPAASAAPAPSRTGEVTTQAGAIADAIATHQAATSGPTTIALLEQSVVHSIALAIQNTVAADQQLDILAQAVLARSAALVLSTAKS